MLGRDNLQEPRITSALAEQEMEGGGTSRMSPLAKVHLSCVLLSPGASTHMVSDGFVSVCHRLMHGQTIGIFSNNNSTRFKLEEHVLTCAQVISYVALPHSNTGNKATS
jgi:hypothetical protein